VRRSLLDVAVLWSSGTVYEAPWTRKTKFEQLLAKAIGGAIQFSASRYDPVGLSSTAMTRPFAPRLPASSPLRSSAPLSGASNFSLAVGAACTFSPGIPHACYEAENRAPSGAKRLRHGAPRSTCAILTICVAQRGCLG
jgi:hypothetical protein